MGRIDAHLECLQPVAIDVALERESIGIGRDKTVELGKRRRLAFAEISPQDAALLDNRIGALPDTFAKLRIFWLRGRFQALPRHVEQPAMKSAAQAAMLEPSEREVRAAMRAVPLDQAVASLL